MRSDAAGCSRQAACHSRTAPSTALGLPPRCLATAPISSTNALSVSSRPSGDSASFAAHSFAFIGHLPCSFYRPVVPTVL